MMCKREWLIILPTPCSPSVPNPMTNPSRENMSEEIGCKHTKNTDADGTFCPYCVGDFQDEISSLRRQIESARKMLDNSLVFIDCACPNDGHYKACYVPRLVTKITKFLEENPK